MSMLGNGKNLKVCSLETYISIQFAGEFGLYFAFQPYGINHPGDDNI